MAKKQRSAKQRANDKRLGAMARKRGKPKRKSTARNPVKTNKRRKNPNNVAKKKTSRRATGSKQLKKAGLGGVGGIATKVILDRLGARSISDDLSYIVASQIGDKPGVIGNAVARQALSRFGGGLGFLNGNGNGNGNAGGGTTGGFGFA